MRTLSLLLFLLTTNQAFAHFDHDQNRFRHIYGIGGAPGVSADYQGATVSMACQDYVDDRGYEGISNIFANGYASGRPTFQCHHERAPGVVFPLRVDEYHCQMQEGATDETCVVNTDINYCQPFALAFGTDSVLSVAQNSTGLRNVNMCRISSTLAGQLAAHDTFAWADIANQCAQDDDANLQCLVTETFAGDGSGATEGCSQYNLTFLGGLEHDYHPNITNIVNSYANDQVCDPHVFAPELEPEHTCAAGDVLAYSTRVNGNPTSANQVPSVCVDQCFAQPITIGSSQPPDQSCTDLVGTSEPLVLFGTGTPDVAGFAQTASCSAGCQLDVTLTEIPDDPDWTFFDCEQNWSYEACIQEATYYYEGERTYNGNHCDGSLPEDTHFVSGMAELTGQSCNVDSNGGITVDSGSGNSTAPPFDDSNIISAIESSNAAINARLDAQNQALDRANESLDNIEADTGSIASDVGRLADGTYSDATVPSGGFYEPTGDTFEQINADLVATAMGVGFVSDVANFFEVNMSAGECPTWSAEIEWVTVEMDQLCSPVATLAFSIVYWIVLGTATFMAARIAFF